MRATWGEGVGVGAISKAANMERRWSARRPFERAFGGRRLLAYTAVVEFGRIKSNAAFIVTGQRNLHQRRAGLRLRHHAGAAHVAAALGRGVGRQLPQVGDADPPGRGLRPNPRRVHRGRLPGGGARRGSQEAHLQPRGCSEGHHEPGAEDANRAAARGPIAGPVRRPLSPRDGAAAAGAA
eukprot:scaffold12093_cov137-Isochrysis_galbana.AAC.18